MDNGMLHLSPAWSNPHCAVAAQQKNHVQEQMHRSRARVGPRGAFPVEDKCARYMWRGLQGAQPEFVRKQMTGSPARSVKVHVIRMPGLLSHLAWGFVHV